LFKAVKAILEPDKRRSANQKEKKGVEATAGERKC